MKTCYSTFNLRKAIKMLIVFSVVFLSVLTTFAQGAVSIKGEVQFSEAEGYHVMILSPDYSVISSSYYETSEFEIENIPAGEFILTIYSPFIMGTQAIPIHNTGDKNVIEVGMIVLENAFELEGVQVTAHRPMFRVEEGKMIYSVENNREFQNLGSLEEILKRLPLVVVENDKINVFGKRNTIVLVNGQPAKNNNWELIAAENIKEIEVITNPSAEYSASGAAVINIITRRNAVEGLNGQVFSSVSKGEFWRSANSFQLGYTDKRLNVFTNVHYNPGKRLFVDGYERYFEDGAEMQNELRQKRRDTKNYSVLAGADYLVHPKHLFGFQYQRIEQAPRRNTHNVNDLMQREDSTHFYTVTNTENVFTRNIYDLNYTYSIDSIGKKLNIGLGYVDYSGEEEGMISELTNGMFAKEKHSQTRSLVDLFTANADYEHKTGNRFSFKTGIYYAHSKNKSYYNLYDEHNKIDSDFSNGTRIYENNFASYFSAYKNWDKFSLTAGLRYKYVDYTSDKRIKTYSNLFPSLDLGYTFSEKLQSNLSYTRKISRPAFKDLDPSTIYVDTLTYFMGNTELKPEYFDNLQLNVVYNRYFVLSLGYSRMNNPIYMSVRLLEPSSKICIAITENLESENRYTLSLSTPYQYKFWSTYNSLGLMYHDNKFYIEGEGYNSSRGMFYAFSSQNFNLPKNFTFSFSYQYNSSGLNGIFTYDKRHVLNAGVSKSFLNDKLSLTLRYNDIFKGDKQRLRVDLKDMDFVYKAKYDASYFTFSVRYKFGTSLRKYVVKENTKEELKRIK